MTTTKVPPPRKLTEQEDNDSFDDFWFQVICYYGRDESFKFIFNNSSLTWQGINVQHRGLSDATKAANLNTLLRALATYASGPYIRTNIVENTTCLQDVKREFMKYLEIELNDMTALDWFEIRRRPTERPLVFFMRLKYHMSKHLLQQGDTYKGNALTSDETLTPSMERFIVMEWLYRLDPRLVKFVKEKFATELSSGSAVLITMVETLAKNIDHYVTQLNNSDASSVSYTSANNSECSLSGNPPMVAFQSSRGGPRGFPPRNRGFRPNSYRNANNTPVRGARYRGSGGSQKTNQDCLYCYMEYRKGAAVEFKHPISNCPILSNMYGKINYLGNDSDGSSNHPYDETIDQFILDTEEDTYGDD